MSRQSMLDYLTCKTNDYEKKDGLVLSGLVPTGDFVTVRSPVCERPILHTGYDVFGVHWTASIPTAHCTLNQKRLIEDIEDWRECVRFPVVDRFDWETMAEHAKTVDREDHVTLCTLINGPFERTTTLMTFEDCLVNAISEPEEFKALIDALCDYRIEIIEHLAEYVKPDVINLHDDWGTSTNMMLSPDLWREVIKPGTKRIYDRCHELGIIVGQHSCGHIEEIVGDMVEMGCQIWEAQGSCNNIAELEKQYGDRLRILVPVEDDQSTEKAGNAADAPPVEAMPIGYQPFKEVPEWLYA